MLIIIKNKDLLNDLLDIEIERFRKIDLKEGIEDTKKYWRKFLKRSFCYRI